MRHMFNYVAHMWNHTEGLSEIFGRVCYSTTLSSSKKICVQTNISIRLQY